MATYTIRPALVEDAEDIARVHVESWKTTYAGIFSDDLLNSLSVDKRAEFWRGHVAARGARSVTLVACDSAGTVVGFVDGGEERTGQLGCDGELNAIYLVRSAQRQGLGTLLVRHLVREMDSMGFTSLAVWVLDQNPSRKFYEALGGRILSEKRIEQGGAWYVELAFGWDQLSDLVSARTYG